MRLAHSEWQGRHSTEVVQFFLPVWYPLKIPSKPYIAHIFQIRNHP
jgi:hypothetical protein